MFGSLLILLILPITDFSNIRGNEFKPISKFFFWLFAVNFFILMWIGSQHPEEPFVNIGQISTGFYFAWFLVLVPAISILENTIINYANKNKKNYNYGGAAPENKSLLQLKYL